MLFPAAVPTRAKRYRNGMNVNVSEWFASFSRSLYYRYIMSGAIVVLYLPIELSIEMKNRKGVTMTNAERVSRIKEILSQPFDEIPLREILSDRIDREIAHHIIADDNSDLFYLIDKKTRRWWNKNYTVLLPGEETMLAQLEKNAPRKMSNLKVGLIAFGIMVAGINFISRTYHDPNHPSIYDQKRSALAPSTIPAGDARQKVKKQNDDKQNAAKQLDQYRQ